ncbi:MAG: hypothetical protein LBD90_03665, partial [Bifidobacteriaceae bacterium]|nr:hypothetical protein [Bifidobacteriaceae bacterium]
PHAKGFEVGEGSTVERFRATLEGIAFVEALSYRKFEELGAPVGDMFTAVGGATRSALWNVIRASVQNRHLRLVENAETAMGAAITAFVGLDMTLSEAVKSIVRSKESIAPDPALVKAYEGATQEFESEWARRTADQLSSS